MAKLNCASIYGVIIPLKDKNNPMIESRITEEGVKLRMTMVVLTSRRVYVSNDVTRKTRSRIDRQRIVTEDQDIIAEFCKSEDGQFKVGLAPYDVVTVYGNLSSIETKRTYVCPKCGEKIVKDKGVVLYIDPVQIAKEKTLSLTKEEIQDIREATIEKANKENIYKNARDYDILIKEIYNQKRQDLLMKKTYQLLSLHCEMSNLITVIGYVCKDVTYTENTNENTGQPYYKCTIPLAVPRSRRIAYQEPERKTDYPYVIVYGRENAQDAKAHLDIGSEILIRGSIQIREHQRDARCPNCAYVKVDTVDTEIVPYQIEYLRNCIFPEGEEEEDFE